MDSMYLRFFTSDEKFPLYIQLGSHEKTMFMHTHADYSELVIVLSGTAWHMVDDKTYFIKKGDVFVVSNNTTHGYSDANDFRICNIMFRNEILLSCKDIQRLVGFHALFIIEPQLTQDHNFKSRLKLQLSEFEYVNRLIMDMLNEYKHKANGYQTIVQAYFMLLATYLARIYCIPLENENGDTINIAKSVSFMENYYTEPFSLEKIAAQSNISVRHFARLFKEYYRTTPGNYILSLRLQHACLLLKNSSLHISDIAFQCGFNDSNYFTRQFRKVFHITPKQYRGQE